MIETATIAQDTYVAEWISDLLLLKTKPDAFAPTSGTNHSVTWR